MPKSTFCRVVFQAEFPFSLIEQKIPRKRNAQEARPQTAARRYLDAESPLASTEGSGAALSPAKCRLSRWLVPARLLEVWPQPAVTYHQSPAETVGAPSWAAHACHTHP